MPLIDEWAANLIAQNEGLTMGAALTEIKAGLTGPKADTYWEMLGDLHGERNPHYAGRKGFHTSRDTIVAKIEGRIWTADQPQPADPFAGLTA